jgi:hypothetical protein
MRGLQGWQVVGGRSEPVSARLSLSVGGRGQLERRERVLVPTVALFFAEWFFQESAEAALAATSQGI